MPTLAELRRRVRHTRMPIAGLERPEPVPEPVLRGYGALLATMVMDLSGVLIRVSRSDPTVVAQSDQVLEHAARHVAEALARLEEACHQLQAAAQARGLRGAASDAWWVARLNAEFIGHPRRRRATRVTRPR
jgi:hypothetical protein